MIRRQKTLQADGQALKGEKGALKDNWLALKGRDEALKDDPEVLIRAIETGSNGNEEALKMEMRRC